MVQVRTLATSKSAHLLQLLQAGSCQTEVIQTDGKFKLPQQLEQLAMGLPSEAIPPQALLETKLHQNAESHLLSMKDVVTGFKLRQTVMNGMGRHRAASSPTESSHHTRRQGTSLSGSDPGGTAGILQGLGAVDQKLIPQHPGHLHSLLDQAIAAVSTADRGLVPLGQSISHTTGQGSRGSLTHELVIKNKQLRATVEGHITLEGTRC